MSENTPATAAGTFTLGDLTVNRMGYGSMRLSGPEIMGPPKDRDEAIAVLRAAVDSGVNHIDTSDFYGPHLVNQLIRDALHPYPDDLVLVTKVGARRSARGAWLPAMSPDQLRQAVTDNLTNLGLDTLPVVNLRLMGTGSHGEELFQGSLAEEFGVLHDLQTEGLIRHLGVSNVGAGPLAEARSIAPVVCLQNMYNVVQRRDDDLVELCAQQGIAFVPYFPLGGFQPLQADRFAATADRVGATTMQLGLAWLLARSPNVLAIPGTSSVAHLHENLFAAALQLDQETLTELDALAS